MFIRKLARADALAATQVSTSYTPDWVGKEMHADCFIRRTRIKLRSKGSAQGEIEVA